jgi:carbamoyl-phosphate synthase large subunit
MHRVLVAGLAGASLGTEIIKCLAVSGKYEIYGCDISNLAFGLYLNNLKGSFVINNESYIESIVKICKENNISFVIPGGEQPMVLLSNAEDIFKNNNISIVCNNKSVVSLFSDKSKTFEFLKTNGFEIPLTLSFKDRDFSKLDFINYPCIVKPSSGTGGSDSVFLATSKDEGILYIELLLRNGRDVIVQEYIDVNNGEFTIGVLSNINGDIISSVAMQRVFNSKLSVSYKGKKGIISSGYSQGLIADFPEIRKQAEAIAIASKSTGPLNVQGRIRDGVLIPFEINPRFSASTYLRALAGVNEIQLYLDYIITGTIENDYNIKEGYYMRSFDEIYIPKDKINN